MWQGVARGNIQHSPDGTAFALRAHAALSGECNYYIHAACIHSPDRAAFALWAHAALSGECNLFVRCYP